MVNHLKCKPYAGRSEKEKVTKQHQFIFQKHYREHGRNAMKDWEFTLTEQCEEAFKREDHVLTTQSQNMLLYRV